MSGPPALGKAYERQCLNELRAAGYRVNPSTAGSSHDTDIIVHNDELPPVRIECKTRLIGTDYKQCVYHTIDGSSYKPHSKDKTVKEFFTTHANNIIIRDTDVYKDCLITSLETILPNIDYIFIKDTGKFRIRESDPLNTNYPIFTINEAVIRIRKKNHDRGRFSVTAALRINKIHNTDNHTDEDISRRQRLITIKHNRRTEMINRRNSMKSPLRYPGGKTRAIKILVPLIERLFGPIVKLTSPFCGGCSIEFHINAPITTINDKFEPLYNFWLQVRDNKPALIGLLREYKTQGIDRNMFQHMRTTIMNTDIDSVKRAAMYFIINRCSFSGATLSGGFSVEAADKRFTTNSIDTLSKLDITDYNISNHDFSEIIAKTPCDHIIFADPPYYLEKKSRLYGNNGDMHEDFDHIGFFHSITKFSGNWLITYNDHPKIRELYSDYEILSAEWAYGMNKSKKSSEIIITSRKKRETVNESSINIIE